MDWWHGSEWGWAESYNEVTSLLHITGDTEELLALPSWGLWEKGRKKRGSHHFLPGKVLDWGFPALAEDTESQRPLSPRSAPWKGSTEKSSGTREAGSFSS